MIPGGDLPGRSAPRFAWPASCEAALLLLLLVGLRFVEMEQLPPAVDLPKMMVASENYVFSAKQNYDATVLGIVKFESGYIPADFFILILSNGRMYGDNLCIPGWYHSLNHPNNKGFFSMDSSVWLMW